jgi:hypothetical protein
MKRGTVSGGPSKENSADFSNLKWKEAMIKNGNIDD